MNDPEVDYYDLADAKERHEYLSQLSSAELYAMASEWIVLYSRAATGDLLARVDEYLTERCDRAYVAYYQEHKRMNGNCIYSVEQDRKYQHACMLVTEWNSLGDARELVRRPLRQMQQAKLKGTRHIDGTVLR